MVKNETILKKELSKVGEVSDRDISKALDYIEQFHFAGIFAEGVLSTFFKYAVEVGFPSSKEMVEKNLGTGHHDADLIIPLLEKVHFLEEYKMPGSDVKDIVSRTSEEDKKIKENPEEEIMVYDYHPDFQQELGFLIKKLKLRGESMSTISNLKEEIQHVLSMVEDEDDFQDVDYFKNLNSDDLEKLSDGLLLALSELESEGKIKKFETPSDAKIALLSAIRKLYQSRGLISKEGRKFQKFGSKRILRGAKGKINHAQSHHESIQINESDLSTDIELQISNYDMKNYDAVDFVTSRVNLKWIPQEEWRKTGLKSLSPIVPDQKVSIDYTVYDSEKEDYGDVKNIELSLPKDIDSEFQSPEDVKDVHLYPIKAEMEIVGDANDPSGWSVKSMTVVWDI